MQFINLSEILKEKFYVTPQQTFQKHAEGPAAKEKKKKKKNSS